MWGPGTPNDRDEVNNSSSCFHQKIVLGPVPNVVESGGNFEDYIRFLFCQLFGPVNRRQNWKGWERSGENT